MVDQELTQINPSRDGSDMKRTALKHDAPRRVRRMTIGSPGGSCLAMMFLGRRF
jgi:hypothetical protein